MELKKCPKGHYYDPQKHSSCPYCGVNINADIVTGRVNPSDDIPVTQPLRPAFQQTENVSPQEPVTMAKGMGAAKGGERTVAFYKKAVGIDPMVGWLVCIDGPDKGRDYRIKSGRNFIGRAETMDICISGDKMISREKHAIIIYDPKTKKFMVQPGESREMFYLNESGVYEITPINARDILEIGESKLVFVPFCGEEFTWE